MNHVAPNIAGTTGDQDRHAVGPPNPTLGLLNLSCRTGHSIYSYNSFRHTPSAALVASDSERGLFGLLAEKKLWSKSEHDSKNTLRP